LLKVAATLPAPEQPLLYRYSASPQSDTLHVMQDGYVYLGMSTFQGSATHANVRLATERGKSASAALVLLRDPRSGAPAWVAVYPGANVPAAQNAQILGGAINAPSGSGAIAATQTGFAAYAIPYDVPVGSFIATYWAKQNPSKMLLGMHYEPLSEQLKQRYRRGSGVVVVVVMHNSPASQAGFLEGDIIVAINGAAVADDTDLGRKMGPLRHQAVKFDVLRGGQPMTLQTTLN
jgi:hypothetical protein